MSDAPIALVHEFDVPVGPEVAWRAVADTEHLNELVYRLGRVRLISKSSRTLRAKTRFAGLNVEFEEHPFEFQAPERYASRRAILNGPYSSVVTDVRLSPETRGTRIRFEQQFTVRPSPLRALFAAAVPVMFKRNAGRLERFLNTSVEPTGEVSWPIQNANAAAVRARAAPYLERLDAAAPEHRDTLRRLVDHLAERSEGDVARMRPFELADAWRAPRRAVLEACLWGAREGLLKLSWDLLCPNCEQPPAGFDSLSGLPSGAHCEMCDVEFGPHLEENVEATFSPAPAIREVQRAFYCFGSPTRTRSWVAQLLVGANAARSVDLALGPGRYRVQAEGASSRFLVEVRESGPSEGELVIPAGVGGQRPHLDGDTLVVGAGRVSLSLKNLDANDHRVQVAHRAFADDAATAADVTALGLFRDLFGSDVLAADQHVDVGRFAVLFTDLVGSTAMYERIGDAAAFGLVRKHFDILFAAVEDHGGHVVKTVGDCVMAGFTDPLSAARAGRACIEGLLALRDTDGSDPGLGLRVGIHVGPCLAVRANGLLDYFGRTVNVAARVEALGATNELVLSSAVVESPGVQAWLDTVERQGLAVSADRKPVKGVEGELDVTRIQVGAREGEAR